MRPCSRYVVELQGYVRYVFHDERLQLIDVYDHKLLPQIIQLLLLRDLPAQGCTEQKVLNHHRNHLLI